MKPGPRATGRAVVAAAALISATFATSWPLVAQEVAVEDLERQAPEPVAPPPVPSEPAAVPAAPPGPAELEAAAETRYLEGDIAGAAALYRQLAVGTSDATERMRLLVAAAWLEHQLGRTTEAQELLQQGLADVPGYPFQSQNYSQEFVDLYERARQRALGERRQRAGELVQRSLREIAADELPRARTTLQQALALSPEEPFALFNLALVEMRAGNRDVAIAGFERLLALEAGRPGSVPVEVRAPALASLGLLYYDKEFYEDSRRFLEQATALDPGAPRTWNNLGLALRRLGDNAAAEAAFRRALELAPGDPQVANNLGLLLLGAQRHGEAVTLLTDATTRSPGDAALWLNLGLAQRGADDRTGAAASLARVMALDADNRLGSAARAATYLAVVRYEQGDGAGAVEAARQALGWNPADIEAHVYLGLGLHMTGDLAGARDAFQAAARLDPTRAEVHNNLGTALVALGDLPAAEAAFRQALAIRPAFPEAQANLDQVVAQIADAATNPPRGGRDRPARRNKPMGVRFDENDFSYLGINGALVESVAGESPASKAGLRKGDIVLGVDGRKVEGPQELLRYVAGVSDKNYVELDIVREGRPQRIRVEIY
jgi:tetratricopeptide (TPR) repeat protein